MRLRNESINISFLRGISRLKRRIQHHRRFGTGRNSFSVRCRHFGIGSEQGVPTPKTKLRCLSLVRNHTGATFFLTISPIVIHHLVFHRPFQHCYSLERRNLHRRRIERLVISLPNFNVKQFATFVYVR